ncbi:hypothetical protein ACSGW5_005201, partial [Escherichia coli]
STSKTPSYTKSVSWQHHPIYIKNGMKCNNGYISRKEDSAVK